MSCIRIPKIQNETVFKRKKEVRMQKLILILSSRILESLVIVSMLLLFMVMTSSPLFAYSGEGEGTELNPYMITTALELDEVRDELNAFYEMKNDIYMSEYIIDNFPTFGWRPIGSKDNPFTGVFDGKGYKIEGLSINCIEVDTIGFFGHVYRGIIRNVEINIDYKVRMYSVESLQYVGGLIGNNTEGIVTNCICVGPIFSNAFFVNIGGLVGYSNGDIENCSSTNTITTWSRCGGLVGANQGTIKGCTSNYDLTSTSSDNEPLVGGLVGWNCGNIENCSSSGTASSHTSFSKSYAGGLVGYNNDGTITNCYNTGSISTNSSMWPTYTGGLVAYNKDGIIRNCYNTGLVNYDNSSNRAYFGGIVGYSDGGYVGNNYYDALTSGCNDKIYGEPKTTEEMMNKKTFVGWDFIKTWKNKQFKSYPYLKEDFTGKKKQK